MSSLGPASDETDPHADVLRAGRWRSWLPLLLAALLNAVLIASAWRALPSLPARVPTHWGVDGRPDAWGDATLGTVATGPIIQLGMCALMALVGALLRGLAGPPGPSAWRRFQAEGTARGATLFIGWLMLLITLLTGATTWSVLRGGDGATAWWALPLAVTVILGVAVAGIGPLVRGEQRRMAARAAEVGVRPTPEEAAEDARWTSSGLLDDPDEPAVLVPKRPGYGAGMTVNVGTRAGRALVTGFVLVVAVLLPLGLWVGAYAAR